MDCAEAFHLGGNAYRNGDFEAAKHHFSIAHGACHDDKRLHLAAHRALIKVALRQADVVGAARNSALLVLAAVFD